MEKLIREARLLDSPPEEVFKEVKSRSDVRKTLEKAGLIFIAENGGGPGVRLKKGRQAMIVIFIPFAIIAMILVYQGTFYTTGSQWYEACWERSVEVHQKNLLFENPLTSDPYKAVIWANCETESLRGIYGSGMVFSPANDGNKENLALEKSCPSDDKDIPIGGSYLLVLKLLQKDGGPRLIDKFLPAEKTISATVNRRWPNCQQERVRQNLPRVIETANGKFKFDWQKSCDRCDERGLEVMQPL